jgi:hypothetical protein
MRLLIVDYCHRLLVDGFILGKRRRKGRESLARFTDKVWLVPSLELVCRCKEVTIKELKEIFPEASDKIVLRKE